MKVGDYFELSKQGVLVHLGNVFNWPGWKDAIPVDKDKIKGSETYYAGCEREKAVEGGAGVKTPVGLGAEATVSLSFSRAGGFALSYEAAWRHKVREVPEVQRQIVALAKKEQWQEEWVLVTEVIEAKAATLVVSAAKSSKFSLHANAALPWALEKVGISDPKLGWTASSWQGSGFSSLCKPGTPLYHCVKVKKTLFGRFKSQTLGLEDFDEVFTDDPYG
ncbi:hypothetical protein [Kribbella ginsengisoli]|uniref:hypothetical protein n=1 Tax=Kribbella ginsengisoli TaxID=363865 RepID=UPI0031DA08EC